MVGEELVSQVRLALQVGKGAEGIDCPVPGDCSSGQVRILPGHGRSTHRRNRAHREPCNADTGNVGLFPQVPGGGQQVLPLFPAEGGGTESQALARAEVPQVYSKHVETPFGVCGEGQVDHIVVVLGAHVPMRYHQAGPVFPVLVKPNHRSQPGAVKALERNLVELAGVWIDAARWVAQRVQHRGVGVGKGALQQAQELRLKRVERNLPQAFHDAFHTSLPLGG